MRQTLNRISRNLAWLTLGELGAKGGMLLLGVIVARTMGPDGMGVFTLALGAALVAVPILAAGQVEVLIREVARAPESAAPLIRSAYWVQRRVGLFALPLMLLGILFLPPKPFQLALLAYLPYALLRTAMLTRAAVFKGLEQMELDAAARAIELGVSVLLVLALGLSAAPPWSTGLALSAGAASAFLWLTSHTQRLPAARAPGRELLLREGLHFAGLAMLMQLLMRTDTFLLGAFGTPTRELGLYGGAIAPVWGLMGAAQLVAVAIYPTLSRAAVRGRAALPSAMGTIATGLVLGLLLAFGVNLLRQPLIRWVFGSNFLPAAPLLALLAWALPGASTVMVTGTVLAAWRRQSWTLLVLLLGFVFPVVLSLRWIPEAGTRGAAKAVVIAQTVTGCGTVLAAYVAARERLESAHGV